MPIEAAALLRESQDPSKDERSLDSQRSAAQRTCRTNDWAYAEEYKDTESASEYGAAKGIIRKDFERLRTDLETGRFGVLIVPSVSRTARDVSVLEDLRKILVRHRMLWCIGDRVMDPSEAADTTLILIEGVLAQTFAQNMSKDVRRGVREARAAGRAPAGRCPFGYSRPPRQVGERVVQVPHPVNGPLLQWAVQTAIPGSISLREVASRWTRESEPEHHWHPSGVRSAVLNPVILGMTKHRGELLPGDWPALVTVEEYSAVREILSRPERRLVSHQRSTTLLSGIATHEGCGGRMGVERAHRSEAMYRCRRKDPGVWLPAARTDRQVTLKLFEEMYFVYARARARLDSSDTVDREEIAREIYDQALSRYHDLNDNWHAHGLELSEYASAVKPLREAVKKARDNLTKVSNRPPVILEGDPRLYPAIWSRMTLEEQRAQVRKFIDVSLTKDGPIVRSKRV